jgi:hypothetical protein
MPPGHRLSLSPDCEIAFTARGPMAGAVLRRRRRALGAAGGSAGHGPAPFSLAHLRQDWRSVRVALRIGKYCRGLRWQRAGGIDRRPCQGVGFRKNRGRKTPSDRVEKPPRPWRLAGSPPFRTRSGTKSVHTSVNAARTSAYATTGPVVDSGRTRPLRWPGFSLDFAGRRPIQTGQEAHRTCSVSSRWASRRSLQR